MKNNSSGQALIEYVLIISTLMLLIIGIMQFSVIYSIKMMVNYAAYTACRVGIVNYNEDGTFNLEIIKSAATKVMSSVSKKSRFGTRTKTADSRIEIESPDENTTISFKRVCMKKNGPKLTVRLKYHYRTSINLIGKLFKSNSISDDGKSTIIITGEATMPVEIGPPFTPE